MRRSDGTAVPAIRPPPALPPVRSRVMSSKRSSPAGHQREVPTLELLGEFTTDEQNLFQQLLCAYREKTCVCSLELGPGTLRPCCRLTVCSHAGSRTIKAGILAFPAGELCLRLALRCLCVYARCSSCQHSSLEVPTTFKLSCSDKVPT